MNASFQLSLLGLLIATTLGGCALPSIKALPADSVPRDITPMGATRPGSGSPAGSPSSSEPAWAEREDVQAPRLYARDGSVVAEQQPGTVAISQDPGQAAGIENGSRWTLLEQYQSSIQRSEDLEFEIRGLTKDLEAAEAREDELEFVLTELKAQMAEMSERLETLGGHNIELASRLTTAQIRRLQSEKLLLEAKLDWRRMEETLKAAQEEEENKNKLGRPLSGFSPPAQTEAASSTPVAATEDQP